LDYAVAFAVPMNTPGLKIICRDLYAEHADPERFPLTTRFDEVDAALIFDDVVVPWERLFVYKDPKLLSGIHYIHTWGQYSTMLRLVTKLEAFLGVAQLLTQYAKAAEQRRVAAPAVVADAGHRDPARLPSSLSCAAT
jgi:4-hydroxyphenylacetate 3-monooxygenase